MTANEFGRHGLAGFGQFDAMIGGITNVSAISQPLEELRDGGIAQLSRWFQALQALLHDRSSNGLATFAQFVAEL